MSDKIKKAIEMLTEEMQDVELGGYAHGWHCNIAMCVYDEIAISSSIRGAGESNEWAYEKANAAASRFMKLLFGVETTNEKTEPCDGCDSSPQDCDGSINCEKLRSQYSLTTYNQLK